MVALGYVCLVKGNMAQAKYFAGQAIHLITSCTSSSSSPAQSPSGGQSGGSEAGELLAALSEEYGPNKRTLLRKIIEVNMGRGVELWEWGGVLVVVLV